MIKREGQKHMKTIFFVQQMRMHFFFFVNIQIFFFTTQTKKIRLVIRKTEKSLN